MKVQQARRDGVRRVSRTACLLAVLLLATGAPAGNAASTAQGKPVPASGLRRSASEKAVVKPTDATLSAVDALRAETSGPVELTWSARGVPTAVYGKFGSSGLASEAEARSFLAARSDLFRLRSDLADLTLVDSRETPGGTRLRFQQDFRGVKVFDAVMSVNFDRDGYVTVVGGDYVDLINLDSVTPVVSAADARGVLLARVGRAPEGEASLDELVVYMAPDGVAHLAYHLIQPTRNATGVAETFEAFVDAISGDLVDEPRDVNQYARGQVYRRGSALAATGNSGLTDDQQIPQSAYQTVELQGLTLQTGLVGQFVDCFSTTAPAFRAAPDGDGDYIFTRSTAPATGAHFDAVQTYFYLDFTQRYIQQLGFTNINNRKVTVNVNGVAADNSFYSPNGTGTGGLTTGSGGVDDAEDAEVMIHEYAHSIHDNSTPNIWGTQGTPGVSAGTRAMGEGFGDYFACSITTQHFEQAATPFETAVMEWDASSYSNEVPPTIRNILSTKRYPADVVGQEHADGEIWSSTLWQIRGDFIALAGDYATGAQQADRLVLQSHFLLASPNVTFVDGALALLAAADSLGYSQAQKDAVATRFGQRGINVGGGAGPNAPTDLAAVKVKRKKVTFRWVDRSNDETGFEIGLRNAAGTIVPIGTIAANATSVLVKKLTPGTTFTFTVRAVNARGASAWADPPLVVTTKPAK
jgi:hypothetical protein